jgi:hypothetical protein
MDRYQNSLRARYARTALGKHDRGAWWRESGQARPRRFRRRCIDGGSTNASEPRIGMTEAEVAAIWGEPEERTQDELREGRIEIWRYAYGRSVQFSNKRRVLAVQR